MKYFDFDALIEELESLPVREVWIEIPLIFVFYMLHTVTSREGSVD